MIAILRILRFIKKSPVIIEMDWYELSVIHKCSCLGSGSSITLLMCRNFHLTIQWLSPFSTGQRLTVNISVRLRSRVQVHIIGFNCNFCQTFTNHWVTVSNQNQNWDKAECFHHCQAQVKVHFLPNCYNIRLRTGCMCWCTGCFMSRLGPSP